ncbi:MAG: type II secretion system GspH family protein [Puniceicoccales bacterium]|nr:type II secretion system GspH family protein [Puniceicoccales bacterium]
MNSARERRSAFTLIEVVVVIAVMGILMSFVVPSISGVLERSRKVNAMNCMKKLADAYLMYRETKGDFISADGHHPKNVADFALTLAQAGFLNDPNGYVFSSDAKAQRINKSKRDTIVAADGITDAQCWSTRDNEHSFSINIIVDLPAFCPPNTTPIIFTRGLNQNGHWDDNGVFKKGGYIAFLDGQVKWFDDVENKLWKADMTATTSDISEAIPSGSRILTALTA